jgi:hypothetical protein
VGVLLFSYGVGVLFVSYLGVGSFFFSSAGDGLASSLGLGLFSEGSRLSVFFLPAKDTLRVSYFLG